MMEFIRVSQDIGVRFYAVPPHMKGSHVDRLPAYFRMNIDGSFAAVCKEPCYQERKFESAELAKAWIEKTLKRF